MGAFLFPSMRPDTLSALRIPTIQTSLAPVHQHQRLGIALGAQRGTGWEAGGGGLGRVAGRGRG